MTPPPSPAADATSSGSPDSSSSADAPDALDALNALAPADSRFSALLHEVLEDALDERARQLSRIAPETEELVDVLRGFLVGGKLLRPRLCFWSAMAISPDAAQDGEIRSLARFGAAIEMLQAAALLHDDLIDRSPTRRGRPAVHVEMATRHRVRALAGEAERFGGSTAIILGDLALSWARDLTTDTEPSAGDPAGLAGPAGRSGPAGPSTRRESARDQFSLLATEVMAGQYLDVLHQDGGFDSPADEEQAALAVIRWKTVSYSTRRPVLLGAVHQGADAEALAALDAWSEAVGTAFQLRDDLLSVVGDEDVTGKPTGGDVREGKRTVLLARTRARTDAPGRALLDAIVGHEEASAEQVEDVQSLMRGTGAVASVAADVDAMRERARTLLDGAPGLSAIGREGLGALAESATDLTGLDLGR